MDPEWDRRLRAEKDRSEGAWRGRGESLEALLAKLSGYLAPDLGQQMPPSFTPGTLEGILNSRQRR